MTPAAALLAVAAAFHSSVLTAEAAEDLLLGVSRVADVERHAHDVEAGHLPPIPGKELPPVDPGADPHRPPPRKVWQTSPSDSDADPEAEEEGTPRFDGPPLPSTRAGSRDSGSVMRREGRAPSDRPPMMPPPPPGWMGGASPKPKGPPHPNWKLETQNYTYGYAMRHYKPAPPLNLTEFAGKDFDSPVAQRCYDGGYSGGHFFDYQLFPHGLQPIPPMTIIARIRSHTMGREQTFLGWKPINDGDKAYSEFQLTADGNLQYRIHDGYKLWTVRASPPIDLADNHWHTVAIVREGENKSIGVATLYCDSYQIGEGYIDGWPTALQPWATSLQINLEENQTQFRGFEGDIEDVRIFDEAVSPAHIKAINDERCSITARPAEFVHSNLGGTGPDSGEQSLRFYRAATFRKKTLDLVVTNKTAYYPKYAERNGVAASGVGRFNLMANRPVRLNFKFVETRTDKEVPVDSLTMTFFHVEQGENSGSQEVFTVEHRVDTYFVTNSSSQIWVTGSDLDYSLTFRSTIHDPNKTEAEELKYGAAMKPSNVDALTDAQSAAAFGVRILRSSNFDMVVQLEGQEGHGRDFFFGGNSSIFKSGVKVIPL